MATHQTADVNLILNVMNWMNDIPNAEVAIARNSPATPGAVSVPPTPQQARRYRLAQQYGLQLQAVIHGRIFNHPPDHEQVADAVHRNYQYHVLIKMLAILRQEMNDDGNVPLNLHMPQITEHVYRPRIFQIGRPENHIAIPAYAANRGSFKVMPSVHNRVRLHMANQVLNARGDHALLATFFLVINSVHHDNQVIEKAELHVGSVEDILSGKQDAAYKWYHYVNCPAFVFLPLLFRHDKIIVSKPHMDKFLEKISGLCLRLPNDQFKVSTFDLENVPREDWVKTARDFGPTWCATMQNLNTASFLADFKLNLAPTTAQYFFEVRDFQHIIKEHLIQRQQKVEGQARR